MAQNTILSSLWPQLLAQAAGKAAEPPARLTGAARGFLQLYAAIADGRIQPADIVAALAERGFKRLLIEGGAKPLSAFLAAGALDRLHLCVAPLVIGAGPIGLDLPPIDRLEEALRPEVSIHRLGVDVLFDLSFPSPPQRGRGGREA